MNILSIIFISSILSITKSDQIVENKAIENTSTIPILKLENRRLPIFPKNNIKFTVRPPNAYNNRPETSTVEEKTERKKLMAKIIPMPKKFNMETVQPVTRKPLMKVRTYTVKMSSSGKNNVKEINREDENHSDKTKKSSIKIMDIKELNNINSSKEIVENKISTEKERKFSKEEEQDRNEFIFLEKKSKDIAINDLLNLSEEDIETTTFAVWAENIRRKRSSNIIEEENMGTTVSPLKYTGRDSKLTNDLHFKNIHH